MLVVWGGYVFAARGLPAVLTRSSVDLHQPVTLENPPSAARDDLATADMPCVLDAIAPPPIAHGAPADFAPALPPPPGVLPMSRAEAASSARAAAGMFGGTPQAPSTATRELPYEGFLSLSGWPSNPSIDPERCVWVVTVHAPMAVKVPPHAAPRHVEVYNVIYDVATGSLIGLVQGRGLVP